MAVIDQELFAPVGKYTDKQGKERTKWRHIGDLVLHPSTGERYIQLDAFFDFSKITHKEGSDKMFLKCVPPGG